jgi:hypothetical protein
MVSYRLPSAPRLLKTPRLSAKRAQQMLLPLPLSRQAEFRELVRMISLWLIFMDPPEHRSTPGCVSSLIKGSRPRRLKPCAAEFQCSNIEFDRPAEAYDPESLLV